MPSPPDPDRRAMSIIGFSRIAGLFAAGAGVIAGIVMAARRREVTCPDGTYFPEGTEDFRCFSHPLMAQGIAVIATCVALGALVLITSEMAAAASRRAGPPSAP